MVTISITLAKAITGQVNPPRALHPGFPLGHPVSYPNQPSRQLHVLRLLLKYAQEIRDPGTIVDLDLTRDDDPAGGCAVCH